MHAPRLPLLRATDLTLAFDGHRVFSGLGFALRPGLTLVRGGDGRGKTSLLKLMAGELSPASGSIERLAPDLFRVDSREAGDDAQTIAQWHEALARAHPGWNAEGCEELCEALGLREHAGKTFAMLSTGTRRKAALAAAFASGASVTLLDTPFAALDAGSRQVVAELLEEAAHHTRRAFVVADHGLPESLRDAPLAAVVDLGD